MFLFRFFKKAKREHTINVIAEFNNSDSSLCEIANLTYYMSKIDNNVQVISDMQAHPNGYRISFKLTFETRINSKRKGNKYTHYVAKMTDWLSDDKCIQRYYYNYN